MSEERASYATRSESLKGNVNAQKYSTKTDAALSLRCHADDKERWMEMAATKKTSLNQWVIETLNAALKKE